jgi:hypothetical protein
MTKPLHQIYLLPLVFITWWTLTFGFKITTTQITYTNSNQSTASTIQAGNNINISTGKGKGQQTLIQGSHLSAGNSINVDTEELNILTSRDTSTSTAPISPSTN